MTALLFSTMSVLLKIFGGASSATSASRMIAKDRLSVILASQRGSELLEGVNLEELQRDVLKVVEVRSSRAANDFSFLDVLLTCQLSVLLLADSY